MFDDLETALREVIDRFDPTGLDRSQLSALMGRSETVRRLAGVAHHQVVAAFHAARAPGDSGQGDSRRVQEQTGASQEEAREQLKLGEDLEDAPEVKQAYKAAELPRAHAAALLRARDAAPEAFAAQEAWLVARVRELSITQARRFLRDWARRENPPDCSDAALHQRRTCTVRHRDGMVSITATLDPKGGAMVQTELERITQLLWRADKDRRPGGDTTRVDQHRADALAAMARRSADANGEGHPTVLAVIDATKLGTDDPVEAETSTGASLDADSVAELLCDADIARIVLGPGSVVLDKGRSTRLATASQRQALLARWGGCACGCDTAWNHLVIHHIHGWAHGGASDIDNLLPVCAPTHEAIHQRKITVQRDGPQLWLRRRDGTRLTPPQRYRTHLATLRPPPREPAADVATDITDVPTRAGGAGCAETAGVGAGRR